MEEGTQGEWGFKAFKQVVKLEFKRKRYAEMMVAYKQMLTYIKSAVTRNYSEKVINKVLDLVQAGSTSQPAGSEAGAQALDLLQTFYETTLSALAEARARYAGGRRDETPAGILRASSRHLARRCGMAMSSVIPASLATSASRRYSFTRPSNLDDAQYEKASPPSIPRPSRTAQVTAAPIAVASPSPTPAAARAAPAATTPRRYEQRPWTESQIW